MIGEDKRKTGLIHNCASMKMVTISTAYEVTGDSYADSREGKEKAALSRYS